MRAAGSATGRGRPSIVWTLVALVLLAGILYAERADSRRDSYGWTLAGGSSAGPVKVSGFVGGLYPGAQKRLRVRLANRYAHPLTVTWVGVVAKRAAPGCAARTLRIGRFSGSRVVPARRVRRLRIPITMRASASDACQGARFPLSFAYGARR